MANAPFSDQLRKLEIPGHIAIVSGNGGLPKINVTTAWSTAGIYLHGAHVTAFQKTSEPPLLFLSRLSHFAAGEPVRGGVPICFPWFGPREGEPAHGLARLLPWDWVESSVAPDGAVTVRLRLPGNSMKPEWSALRTEFTVTATDRLAMELIATNESADKSQEIENCLHTYFHVGDVNQLSITGLQGAPFDDFAFGANGVRRRGDTAPLRITQETNRVYPGHAGLVEIHDKDFQRRVRVEKFNSNSTVVWNPWTTQKMPGDFDPAEHKHMVCVESGNVKQNKVSLSPGKTASLKVILSSEPL